MSAETAIVDSPAAFARAAAPLFAAPPDRPALPRGAFLVAPPAEFHLEVESAADNRYMDLGAAIDPERAAAQHRALAECLQRAGVPVFLLPGVAGQSDGVFVNNAYATVSGGGLVIGAMRHAARRAETARPDVRALFEGAWRYHVEDLSGRGCIAELTGPLVIDRGRGIGYCGMTGRVDAAGAAAMHRAFALRLTFRFDLKPDEYHTNVVLAVLAGRACVLHAAAFADPAVPDAIAAGYPDATLWLDEDEKRNFVANCIALTARDLFLSTRARRALRPSTAARLESLGFRMHDVELSEFEKAGGSLRCLVAELY